MTVVADTLVNVRAAVPPKLTAVTPVRLVPVIVMVAPAPALVGVKEEIAGCTVLKALEEYIPLPCVPAIT